MKSSSRFCLALALRQPACERSGPASDAGGDILSMYGSLTGEGVVRAVIEEGLSCIDEINAAGGVLGGWSISS
jgi:hypothetical protein